MRQLRRKVAEFFISELHSSGLKGRRILKADAVVGAWNPQSDLKNPVVGQVSNGEELGAVSLLADSNFKRGSQVVLDGLVGINSGVNSVELEARFEGGEDYFRGREQCIFLHSTLPAALCLSILVHASQCPMAEHVNEAGRVAMVSSAAAVGDGTLPEADVVLPAVSPGTPREVTASIQTPPLLQKGKDTVGGPSGLALSITASAAVHHSWCRHRVLGGSYSSASSRVRQGEGGSALRRRIQTNCHRHEGGFEVDGGEAASEACAIPIPGGSQGCRQRA